MPWFQCEDCGESIKKPKIPQHHRSCRASAFTCIDCQQTFDSQSVQGHTVCMTEDEKYRQGKSKPIYQQNGDQAAKSAECNDEYGLAQHPPWRCNLCNTLCTSKESLAGHASGTKHQKKLKHHLNQSVAPPQSNGTQENNEPQANCTQKANGNSGQSQNQQSENQVAENGANGGMSNGHMIPFEIEQNKATEQEQEGGKNSMKSKKLKKYKKSHPLETSDVEINGNSIGDNPQNDVKPQQQETPKTKKSKKQKQINQSPNKENLQPDHLQNGASNGHNKDTKKRKRQQVDSHQEEQKSQDQEMEVEEVAPRKSHKKSLETDSNDITPLKVFGFAAQKLQKTGSQLTLVKLAAKVTKLFGINPKDNPEIKSKVKGLITQSTQFIIEDQNVRLNTLNKR